MRVGGDRWLWAIPVIIIFLVACAAASRGAGEPLSLPSPSHNDVTHKYQVRRVGTFDVAPLIVHGIRVFDLAAPASRDRSAYPLIAARIDLVTDNINEVAPPQAKLTDVFEPPATRYDPNTFEVKLVQRNGYQTLVAADAHGARETPILTLTELDEKYNGLSARELGRSWADTLQSVLVNELRQREPGAFERQLSNAALVVLFGLVGTVVIFVVRLWLAKLRSRVDARLESDWELTGVAEDRDRVTRPRKALRGTIVLFEWLLGWSIAILWGAVVLLILNAFGPTQPLARRLSSQLLAIFAIWFAAGLVNRLGGLLIERFGHVWRLRPFESVDEAGRRQLRLPTILRSLDYAKTAFVYITAVAFTLSVLGTSASAVVTLGAAVAFAISFGAQNLVKDFVNGFFVLIEDQYAIGDYVTVGSTAGFVETVTLRMTQVRTEDGRLITIPNSQVAIVENWTRGWSRVDYRIAVAFDCDVDHALSVFERVLRDIARDPVWGLKVTQEPKILGVESVSSLGVVLRGQVQTGPGKMFTLNREINRRMLEAFAREGIVLGMPISRMYHAQSEIAPARETEKPSVEV